MPITIDSQLINSKELKIEAIDAIRNAAISKALEKAYDLWGPSQAVTVRDLNASDMSYTNNIFTETSNATINQWNAMAFGAFTIATGTVIGIYGIKPLVLLDATIKRLPLTGIRIEVGGARVLQCNVQTLDQTANAASLSPQRASAGYFKSPVVISEDITCTIYEYTITASTAYTPTWLGVTIEKEGISLKP